MTVLWVTLAAALCFSTMTFFPIQFSLDRCGFIGNSAMPTSARLRIPSRTLVPSNRTVQRNVDWRLAMPGVRAVEWNGVSSCRESNMWYIVQCGAIITGSIFSQIFTRHPMARLLGRGKGCLLQIQHQTDILWCFDGKSQSLGLSFQPSPAPHD